MRRKRYAGVRICKRGYSERYHNLTINGDFYANDKNYKSAMDYLVDWTPDEQLRNFVDKYVPDYELKIKNRTVEVKFNYPRDFEDLCHYVLDDTDISDEQLESIIGTNNLDLLKKIILEHE